MKNYDMELEKFSAKKFTSRIPITTIPMNLILCQDMLFNISGRYSHISYLKFSSAFFFDFYKIRTKTDWDSIYVIDGVEFLHRKSGTTLPLVRDRELYSFLYADDDYVSTFIDAVQTNSWLNELTSRTGGLLSHRINSIRQNIQGIMCSGFHADIKEFIPDEYTPRGVWGFDYMFRWKRDDLDVELEVSKEIHLIPLDDYINLFKGVEANAPSRKIIV